MRQLRNTTRKSRWFTVMPVLFVLAFGMTGTGAAASPQRVSCLFDLPIETLMQIRIGAEWMLSYRTPAEDGEVPAPLQEASRSHVVGLQNLHPSVEADKSAITWNR